MGMSRNGSAELRQERRTNLLGREFATHKDYSEETAKNIDAEVVEIVKRNYDKAITLLNKHIEILHRISKNTGKEVLNSAEIDEIIGSAKPAEQAAQTQ